MVLSTNYQLTTIIIDVIGPVLIGRVKETEMPKTTVKTIGPNINIVLLTQMALSKIIANFLAIIGVRLRNQ